VRSTDRPSPFRLSRTTGHPHFRYSRLCCPFLLCYVNQIPTTLSSEKSLCSGRRIGKNTIGLRRSGPKSTLNCLFGIRRKSLTPIPYRKAANRENLARRQRFKDGLDQSFGVAGSTSGTSTPVAVSSPRPAHALPVTTSSGRPVAGTSRVASSNSVRTTSTSSTNAIDVIDLDGDDEVSVTGTTTRSGSEARAGQRRRIENGDEGGTTQGRRVRSRLNETAHSASGNGGDSPDGGNGLIVLD
jgi:hypothetical protein